MELSAQFDWIPDPSLHVGSLLGRAARPLNGTTMENLQRTNMGQPLTGISQMDAERRMYGFYNAGQSAPPEIRNSFLDGKV